MSENENTPVSPEASKTEAPAQSPPSSSEEALRVENGKLLDRLMRLQAEFENFRKRSAKERSEWTARAVEGLIADLLPVIDAFDRAEESAARGADLPGLLEGTRATRRLLDGALAARGLEPIDALKKPFDAAVHEAALMRPAGEGETPGTIVVEIARGYRLGDRTLRPTRGVVAVAAAAPTVAPGTEED